MQPVKASISTAVNQRSPSVVTDSSLKRFSYMKLNGDASPQLNQCVDTKRLELAIAGSGARIKVGISFVRFFFFFVSLFTIAM